MKFKIGDRVRVTDQFPAAIGTITDVTGMIQGTPFWSSKPMYLVSVEEWDKNSNGSRWISETFLTRTLD